MKMSRCVLKTLIAEDEEEGLGVNIKRTIGGSKLDYLDPFLQLDEFRAQKPACLPDHPRRGFETITYVLEGCMEHENFCGHQGFINIGGVQCLSAGCGIVLSESPSSEEEAVGVKIYINVTKDCKLMPPTHQYIPSKDLPVVIKEHGIQVKVISGEAFGKKSSLMSRTPNYILDIILDAHCSLEQPLPSDWNAAVYVLSGKLEIGPALNRSTCLPQEAVILSKGESVCLHNQEKQSSRILLIAGKPLGEVVAREGLFVMNSEKEIQQTIKDYQLGHKGFENASNWNSKTGLEYLESQF